MNHTAEKLLTFIKESPIAFQAGEMMKNRFTENGFTELKDLDLKSTFELDM